MAERGEGSRTEVIGRFFERFGIRLGTYAFEGDGLVSAIDDLLGRSALTARMAAMAADAQASPGTAKAADLIEQLVREPAPAFRN